MKESDFYNYPAESQFFIGGSSAHFHIRFIESLSICELRLNGQYLSLSPYDIVMISSTATVTLENLGAPAKLNILTERLHAPSPLNLVVVGDNPMVHDLMNGGEHELHYVVYRNLNQQLKHRYVELIMELERHDLTDNFIDYQREMAVGLLMTELLRNHEATISITDSDFPGSNIHHASADTQSGMIFNYLVLHSQDATLRGTAAHFGYDKNYFSRLCRKLFNKSFTEQLAFVRIELAKRMLGLSNKGIEEISFELGYKNISSFFAIFKRSVNMTPREYRESHGYRPARESSTPLK
ncbi:helix-turn-helix domain-containing protein [Lactiplantibacillus garii]|nr:helix-turn-helix transcriptional regulator [Lactiplantibacillus garii]